MLQKIEFEPGLTLSSQEYLGDPNYTFTLIEKNDNRIYCFKHNNPSNKNVLFSYILHDNIFETSFALIPYSKYKALIFENAKNKKIYKEIRDSLIDLREMEMEKNPFKLLPIKISEIITPDIGVNNESPVPFFKIDFDERDFTQVVDYLAKNRRGQSVLIYPSINKSKNIWMGKKIMTVKL